MIVRMGDLHVHAWFRVFENFVGDVLLGKSFTDRCIRSIFASERKVVLWTSRKASIQASLRTMSLIFLETCVQNVEMAHAAKSIEVNIDEEEKVFDLCRVSVQTKIPPFPQTAVSVRCQWEVHLLVEKHFSIEWRCSIAARGIMDILPRVLIL